MKKRTYTKTDYSYHPRMRKKMAHYLKSADGGFKQIGGYILPGKRVMRNRIILIIIAAILTAIGLYNALL